MRTFGTIPISANEMVGSLLCEFFFFSVYFLEEVKLPIGVPLAFTFSMGNKLTLNTAALLLSLNE